MLYEFVSASGLQAQCNALNASTDCQDASKDRGMIDTLRVNAGLPPSGKTAVGCGGEPIEQGYLGSICPDRPKTGSGSGGQSSGGAGTAPGASAQSSSSTLLDLGALFGGLFG